VKNVWRIFQQAPLQAAQLLISNPNQFLLYGTRIMKLLFASAIVSLGLALSPAVFAQNAAPSDQAPQMQQQAKSRDSGTQHATDSGYGMGSAGTSNASFAHASSHGEIVSHEGRNGLFAHH
jgi:hypothetical protein